MTNSRANRAGREFRRAAARLAQNRADIEALREGRNWVDVIAAYRAMHEYPLRKVTMGVRVMTSTALNDVGAPRPTQRFKRMDRILYKLLRHPNMALSTMQDIGGCRSVFDTIADLRRVERHIVRSRLWRDAHVEDYITNPKPDGYRAVHIITKRDNRWIEVQLRTQAQDGWASAVEDALSLTGYDIKDGVGPGDLKLYFKLAGDRLALEDQGLPADEELEEQFARVRNEIRQYYAAP